jgi:hypothetical protein
MGIMFAEVDVKPPAMVRQINNDANNNLEAIVLILLYI